MRGLPVLNTHTREDQLRSLFDLGLIVKMVFATIEIVGGILVLFVSRLFVIHIAEIVTDGELAQDPDDFAANTILDAAHTFSLHAHYLVAAYLIFRGLIKIGLIIGILRHHPWAYPLFTLSLSLFASYEIYRSITTDSLILFALALFDLAMFGLMIHLYRDHLNRRAFGV